MLVTTFSNGRYIDEILLIWDGGPDVCSSFVAYCNAKSMGLSFTHVLDPKELVFLDLVLSHQGQTIIMHNHVNPTGGNSYLNFSSCHHPAWKRNIPSGQFNRLRRICSREEDYTLQGALTSQKFLDKGYPLN